MAIDRCIICGGVGKIATRSIGGPGWVCGYICLAETWKDEKIDAALQRERRRWTKKRDAQSDAEEEE